MRAVAIGLVLLNHAWPTGTFNGALDFLKQSGWIGVDLFFVLSGMLISGILLDTRTDRAYFRNFYARRFLRIFPLYYAFLAASFIGIPLIRSGGWHASPFLRQAGSPLWYFGYLTNLKPAITGIDPPGELRILWSLAIEEHFYLLFPLAVRFVRPKRLWWVLVGVVLFSFGFRVWLARAIPGSQELAYMLTPARMDSLAMGCLLTLVLRSGRPLPDSRWWLIGGIGLLAFVGALTGFQRSNVLLRTGGYTLIALGFALLLGWVMAEKNRATTGWLRLAPVRYLGTISYGVYVLHVAVAAAVLQFIGGAAIVRDSRLLGNSIAIASALAAAAISWHWFERPLLRFKHNFESRHHPGAAASHTATTATIAR